jgi:outer membrane protein TolC
MKPTWTGLISTVLLMCAQPVFAQDADLPAPGTGPYIEPDFMREAPVLPEGLTGGGVRRLALQEAIFLAVENNLGIVLTRAALRASQYDVAASRGQFEPTLSGWYSHEDSVSPPATSQEGMAGDFLEIQRDGWFLGLNHRLRSGTQLGLDFTNSRAESSAGTAVEPIVFRTGVDVRVTQPLLRGFSLDLDVPSRDILRAEIASESARHDVLISMIDTVRRTDDAYWELVQALKSYQVQLGSLELARQQMELTQRQIAAGILAPADLISAEGTLAERELSLVQAESAIVQSADRLRHVLNLPRPEWSVAILPVDAPAFEPVDADVDEAMQKALSLRPELSKRQLDMERAALEVRLARNDRLPALDVTFRYGVLGQDEMYGAALGQMPSIDARTWSVLLNFSWAPLGRESKARLEALRTQERAAAIQRDQQVLDLYTEVRAAVRELDTAARQVRAAARFRDLAERSLDAEQRKFMSGMTSNFIVAQRQAELARARQAEVAAVIAHRQAKTRLELVTGELLDSRHIRVDVAAPTRSAAPR